MLDNPKFEDSLKKTSISSFIGLFPLTWAAIENSVVCPIVQKLLKIKSEYLK